MKILCADINFEDFLKKAAKALLLMLDYDGTLAPLIKDRMQAFPYPGIKERLAALLEFKKNRTVIISGRSLSDLERLLEVHQDLELWGSHGLERKLPDGRTTCSLINKTRVKELEKGKEICLEYVTPEYCETKPYGIALHWRGMDEEQKRNAAASIESQWLQIASEHGMELHHFDGGIELRCKEKNKGDAVSELLSEIPNDTAVAYLGDDFTDEQAFERLGNRGLKILVRGHLRQTLADIHLVPPNELLTFLDRLILISKKGHYE